MWKLEHITNNTGVFLQQGCDLTVSRQDGSWLHLPGDASISRKHAVLRVTHSPQAVKRNVPATVELKDVSAKNGTYIKRHQAIGESAEFSDADRLAAGATVSLKNGDVVRFGLYNYSYRVVRSPLVVATSMLAAAETEAVLTNLLHLGATFSKDWTDQCTHLVMDSIKLSAKVSCALAYGAAIVTPTYLTALRTAVTKKESVLPPHKPYLPPITEPGIQPKPELFERNVERRRVLSGLRFLFASQRTCKRLSSIVLSAGGSCGLLSSQDHAALAGGEALLVRGLEDGAASASQGSPFTVALGVVQRAGLNPVPESDIALAVLYCSTERFCNPALSQQNLVAPAVSQSQQESLVVFAPGTESFSATPPRSHRSTSAAFPVKSTVVTAAPSTAAVVPDTPGSTASTASRTPRSSAAASTLSCRSVEAPAVIKRNHRTDESSRIREDRNQSADVHALHKEISLEATPSLQLSSPSRPGDQRESGADMADSPRCSRLSRKRVLSSPSSICGAPPPKRPTSDAAIEPTQDLPVTQDEDTFGEIMDLEVSRFAPRDASTQKMEEEVIRQPDRNNVSNTALADASAAGREENSKRTRAVVTSIPPTPTPPSQPFPSSISVPPTSTTPQSHPSPSRAISGATCQTSLSPDKARVELRKQQQRRETITFSTLPSLPPETYADRSLFPAGVTDDPPPTLDPPSLPAAEWLPAPRRPLAAVNEESSSRQNSNMNSDLSGILDPPLDTAGVDSRVGGPVKVERRDSRDMHVFQMPTANVRRRKTKQTPTADSSPTEAMPPLGGIKRSRSMEVQEVREQQAVEPTSRRIKYEPVSLPASSLRMPAVPPAPVATTQGYLSKPTRANGCNNTTGGINRTSTAVAGASEPVAAATVTATKTNDINQDVKPDSVVTRLSRAVVVSLVLRTSVLGEDYIPPSKNTTVGGKKNFKRFKKVTRVSSDRPSQAMPRIIGGKDLKPHTAFYKETDADRKAIQRLESLRETWLSQHPDAFSYLEEQERDREERLREEMEDDVDQGNAGGIRGRGASMMSYLTTASTSGSANGRNVPSPTAHMPALPVFRMPAANVRKRQRRT